MAPQKKNICVGECPESSPKLSPCPPRSIIYPKEEVQQAISKAHRQQTREHVTGITLNSQRPFIPGLSLRPQSKDNIRNVAQ